MINIGYDTDWKKLAISYKTVHNEKEIEVILMNNTS